MSERVPHAGDIVWVVFDPIIGTEQAGRRPAIVLTAFDYNSITGRAIVCPINSTQRDWPTNVPIPVGGKVEGDVLVDQVRAVNRKGRSFRFIEAASPSLVESVRATLARVLELVAT